MAKQAEYQNQIAAETTRPLSPAEKAWVTRRQAAAERGEVYAPARRSKVDVTAIDSVLQEFEQVDGQGMPDYHAIALKMKRLLETAKAATTSPRRDLATTTPPAGFHRTTGRPTALPAPNFPDYPVQKVSSFKIESPIILVTFADGRTVRAPAVSAQGKPLNIGRGLRIAIHFYQHRVYRQLGFKRGRASWIEVPDIVEVITETGATYDARECTFRTIEARKGNGLRAPHPAFKVKPKQIGGPSDHG